MLVAFFLSFFFVFFLFKSGWGGGLALSSFCWGSLQWVAKVWIEGMEVKSKMKLPGARSRPAVVLSLVLFFNGRGWRGPALKSTIHGCPLL